MRGRLARNRAGYAVLTAPFDGIVSGVPATPAAPAPSPNSAASVWLVEAKTGALKQTAVQVLSQSTDHVRVTGLPDGALVMSVGAQKLDAGLKVQPVQRPLAALTSSQSWPVVQQ